MTKSNATGATVGNITFGPPDDNITQTRVVTLSERNAIRINEFLDAIQEFAKNGEFKQLEERVAAIERIEI